MDSGIGIPDSSPESTVRAIKKISEEVANELGGTCTIDEKIDGLSNSSTFDFTVGGRGFRISLHYIESQNLDCSDVWGTGIIWQTETTEKLLLQLECDEKPNSKPSFWWRVYPEKVRQVNEGNDNEIPRFEQPSHTLDRSTLRALLHERLSPVPRE